MDNEIEYLQKKLIVAYKKQPWYGDSITDVLKTITPQQATRTPIEAANSIAGLVSHILAWRIFMQKRLEGDQTSDVNNEASFRWQAHSESPEEAWITLLQKLDENQEKILQLISGLSPAQLDETVAGRGYTLRDLIEGVIQHDLYHLGQINLIRKYFV